MGFTPRDIDRMSLFEFKACVDGYAAAHNPEAAAKQRAGDIDEDRLAAMQIEGFT